MAIDFHAYIQTRSFLDHLRRRTRFPRIEEVDGKEYVVTAPGVARPVRPEQNDLEARAREMTSAGVGAQVLRLQHVNGVDSFEPDEGLDIARAANEELAALARASCGRFVPFAAVPMRDPRAAVAELQRAVTVLGHRGVGLPAWCDGLPLDDARFECVLAEVDRLGVPAIVLPNHPTTTDSAVEPYGWLKGAFGMQVDLAICALRLLSSGLTQRYARMPIILVNLGGVLPFSLSRLDHFWARMNTGQRPLTEAPSRAVRRFYFGTASASTHAIRLTAAAIGADRMVLGSDYPSADLAASVNAITRSGMSEEEIEQVLEANARRILRWKESPSGCPS